MARSTRLSRRAGRAVLALVFAMALSVPTKALAEALEFGGTVWHDVARQAGIDPALLYALCLAESSRHVAGGRYTPWPWVLRTPTGGYWFDSRAAARRGLEAVLDKWPPKRVDVGAAQVNVGWHRRRFGEPEKLLDLRYNLQVAARILADTVDSTRDPVLGIGRYTAWVDAQQARRYGQRVWSYFRTISFAHGDPAQDYIVATEARLDRLVRRVAER